MPIAVGVEFDEPPFAEGIAPAGAFAAGFELFCDPIRPLSAVAASAPVCGFDVGFGAVVAVDVGTGTGDGIVFVFAVASGVTVAVVEFAVFGDAPLFIPVAALPIVVELFAAAGAGAAVGVGVVVVDAGFVSVDVVLAPVAAPATPV